MFLNGANFCFKITLLITPLQLISFVLYSNFIFTATLQLCASFTLHHIWQRSLWSPSHNSRKDLLQSWLVQSRSPEQVWLLFTQRHSTTTIQTSAGRLFYCVVVIRSWITRSPQGDALLFMCLADAVVAVAHHVVAGVTVVKIDVGRAVRAGTGAELRQVTWVTGLSTHGPSWLKLWRTETSKSDCSQKIWHPISICETKDWWEFLIVILILKLPSLV